MTDYSVLIINGDSVAESNAEYLGILETTENQAIKVRQVVAAEEDLLIILEISDASYLVKTGGAFTSFTVYEIQVDRSLTVSTAALAQRLSYFNVDASQRLYGLAAQSYGGNGVGFVI